jgi:hypothetical protein
MGRLLILWQRMSPYALYPLCKGERELWIRKTPFRYNLVLHDVHFQTASQLSPSAINPAQNFSK